MSDSCIFLCPHCDGTIIMKKLNCGVFRHGVLKKNGKQINPHAPKEVCERYLRKNQIYGCGKPFKIVMKESTDDSELVSKFITEKCEYI